MTKEAVMVQSMDNFIPEIYQERLHNLLTSDRFAWYWNDKSVYLDSESADFESKDYQFTHVLLREGNINSEFAESVLPLVYFFELHSDMKVKYIEKIKANLTTHINYTDEDLKQCIHKDMNTNTDTKFMTILYYVNDADGDTVIYHDEKESTFSPQKGRAIWFNADLDHRPSTPVNSKRRIVVNIVVEV